MPARDFSALSQVKLATYRIGDQIHVGAVSGDGVIDVGARLGFWSLRELLERGLLGAAQRLQAERPDHDVSAVTFLPAIADQHHIVCVGVNYRDHLAEVQAAGITRPPPNLSVDLYSLS